MAVTQADKAQRFRDLHKASAHFVIANAWDAGSARILTALGFKALATSSGACAGVLGGQSLNPEERTMKRLCAWAARGPAAGITGIKGACGFIYLIYPIELLGIRAASILFETNCRAFLSLPAATEKIRCNLISPNNL